MGQGLLYQVSCKDKLVLRAMAVNDLGSGLTYVPQIPVKQLRLVKELKIRGFK